MCRAMIGLDVEARWFAGKGRRLEAVVLRDRLGPLAIADVTYGDAGSERYLIVEEDPAVWAGVLADPPRSAGGRLELRPGGFPIPRDLGGAFVPSTDQTNTLAVLGGRLLVKAYRRLEAGVHPEVELLGALDGTPGAGAGLRREPALDRRRRRRHRGRGAAGVRPRGGGRVGDADRRRRRGAQGGL
jgi:hypothetical protein